MGTAYYIVQDNQSPDFDTFVNGKAIAKEISNIDSICEKLSLSKLDDFVSMSSDDIADIIGEEIDIPEQQVHWFSADEGLKLIQALTQHIKANPNDVKGSTAIIEELVEYIDVLNKAKAIGAKWHFNIDI